MEMKAIGRMCKMDNELELFQAALNNNIQAAQFCLDIFYIAHLWDDLIDKDKVRTDDEINRCFEILLIGLPSNSFYRQYEDSIRPMLHTSILTWYESNRRQSGSEFDKFYAFFLRNTLLNIIYFSCAVTNGNAEILHDYFCKHMKSEYENFIKEAEDA